MRHLDDIRFQQMPRLAEKDIAAVGPEIAVMGEVGLAGEVRTVPQCERRVSECARLGFTTIIVPRSGAKRLQAPEGVRIVGVDTVAQALSIIF